MKNSLENIYISTNEFSDWVKERVFKDKDLISLEELTIIFEDQLDRCEYLEEKIKDLDEENREMNEELCYRGTRYY